MKKNVKRGFKPGLIRLLLSFLFFAFFTPVQAQTISGTVSDEGGKKISGISVTVKGSTAGTTTDASGQYKINAASTAILLFSSVGYTTIVGSYPI